MKHRKKDSGLSETEYKQVKVVSTNPTVPQNTWFTGESSRSWMSGADIPNFHARKRRGELIPFTPFEQVEFQNRITMGTFRSDSKSNSSWTEITNWMGLTLNTDYRIDDNPASHYIVPTPDLSSTELLIQRAAAAIYSKGWDAATFAVEFPSLRRQFRKLGKTVSRLLDSRSLGRLDSAGIQRAWLEGRYGWRTLAYDVRDLNSALTDWDAKRKIHAERVGLSYTDSGTDQLMSNQKVGNLVYNFTKEWTYTHSIRGIVAGRIQPPRFAVDPLRTGWEVIPLSFVLDWAYSVGTAIEAAGFLRHSSEHTCAFGWRTDAKTTFDLDGGESDTHTGSARVVWEWEGYQESRVPSTVSTIPQLTNRRLSADMGLDLQAISRLRGRL